MRKGRVLPTVQVGKVKGFRRFIDDMREGLSYIRENPSIIVKYIMLLVIWSTLRTINVLLAPFSKNTLNAGVQGFGYIDSGFAVGAIVGNMLLPAVIRKIGANATMTIGMLGMGVCLSIFAFTNSLWSAVAWYTALGVLFQVAILYITKAQESVPLTHQGRVHSTFNMLFSIASLFVYLIMGSLSEVVSSRWLYFGQGLIVIGAGLFAYRLIYRAGATATQDVSTNAHADHRRQEKDLAEGEGVRIADGALSEESPA
jgi:MFS family permease